MVEAGSLVTQPEPPGGPDSVSDPAGLIRIATMMQTLREEVRGLPLDESGRERLTEIHRRAVEAIKETLSDDLREELDGFALPLEGTPTEGELRVAQAQLVGWLEGLFRGIQTAVFSQQMSAQRQLQELSNPGARREDQGLRGQYL